ncbi:MAG: site-specific integrase, partial [Anaerolineae bacterium]
VVAGPEHFYGQKASQLARAITEVLLEDKEETDNLTALDPVEGAIKDFFARLEVPGRYFHRALVVWDNYLRYASEPIRQIDDPRVWAAAVMWTMSWIGRSRPRREEIVRVIQGLPAREIKRRAHLMWDALGLHEDRRWLEREMACVEVVDGEEDEISRAVKEFLEELGWRRSVSTVRRYREDLALLWQYLVQRADVCSLNEIAPEHLVEFVSCWYMGASGVKRSVAQAKKLLGTVWRFCQWLDSRKGTELAEAYLPFHKELRLEIPRVLTLAGLLPGSSFAGPQRFERQVSDYFRVDRLARHTMHLYGLESELKLRGVVIPPEGKDLFRPADILYLTVGKRKNRWYIIDSGAVFPALAAP